MMKRLWRLGVWLSEATLAASCQVAELRLQSLKLARACTRMYLDYLE